MMEKSKVIFIFVFVENVGMLMGIVIIMCVIYGIFVSVYVYLVNCDWECDEDIGNKRNDLGFNCKDIGNYLKYFMYFFI